MILNFYMGYKTGYNYYGTEEEKRTFFKSVREAQTADSIKDAYVIIARSRFEAGIQSYEDYPEFVKNPPVEWHLLKAVDSNLLYYAP